MTVSDRTRREIELMHFMSSKPELHDLTVVGGEGIIFVGWEQLEFRVLDLLQQRAEVFGWPDTVTADLTREMQAILRTALTNRRPENRIELEMNQ